MTTKALAILLVTIAALSFAQVILTVKPTPPPPPQDEQEFGDYYK